MRYRWATSLVLCLSCLGSFVVAEDAAAPAGKAPAPRLRYTISKETTHLTEPLTKTGEIDLVAGLNAALSEGVTPENNAMVLYVQAIGPGLRDETKAEYFRLLGVDPPPAEGDYFVEFTKFHERTTGTRDGAYEELQAAKKAPWNKADFPTVAAWLTANEAPLQLVIEGAQRERYFSPYVVPGDYFRLNRVTVARLLTLRGIAGALSARAMLRLGEGKVEAANHDLLTLHRLGRHIAQGGTFLETLIGIVIDELADAANVRLAQHVSLSQVQAAEMLADLARLPAMPPMSQKFDFAERLTFIDAVLSFSQAGDFSSLVKGQGLRAGSSRPLTSSVASWLIDWDIVLRRGNQWYDRIVAAMEAPTPAERQAAIEQLENDLRVLEARAAEPGRTTLAWLTLQGRSELVADKLLVQLPPEMAFANDVELRNQITSKLTHVALALSAYRTEHNEYPDSLEAIVPKYLNSAPVDPFSGKPVVYRKLEDGYMVYSIGTNRRDEGGKTFDTGGDDLVITTVTVEEARPQE